jgi:hypothetical protein
MFGCRHGASPLAQQPRTTLPLAADCRGLSACCCRLASLPCAVGLAGARGPGADRPVGVSGARCRRAGGGPGAGARRGGAVFGRRGGGAPRSHWLAAGLCGGSFAGTPRGRSWLWGRLEGAAGAATRTSGGASGGGGPFLKEGTALAGGERQWHPARAALFLPAFGVRPPTAPAETGISSFMRVGSPHATCGALYTRWSAQAERPPRLTALHDHATPP